MVCELEHRAEGTEPLNVTLVQHLPWFMRPYLHTLRVTGLPATLRPVPVHDTWYLPAELRGRPTVLELVLEVPPATTVTVVWDFQYVFLHTAEHRPDANRGFDIGAAFATTTVRAGDGLLLPGGLQWTHRLLDGADGGPAARERITIYTANALAPLPTPDFSMPYNVITMTSTLVALAFGMMFNLMTREVVVRDPNDPPTPLHRLLQRLRSRRTAASAPATTL